LPCLLKRAQLIKRSIGFLILAGSILSFRIRITHKEVQVEAKAMAKMRRSKRKKKFTQIQ
jgi:hypothetical protein